MQQLALLFIVAFVGTDAIVLRGQVHVNASSAGGRHGKPDCACIGIDELEGTTTIHLKDGKKKVDVEFPADLGSHCEAWDIKKNPSCPGASWCKQEWCYVDPCKCKNAGDLPKPSSYLPDAKYQGKPVHYSYATCGGKDSFSAAEVKKTTKELEKTCAVKVDSAEWGAESCRCVGVGPQEGSTKVTIDGKLKKFPADTGAMCKKWEENRHPSCKGDKPPAWCSQAWCYVDPCSCKMTTPPKTSSYLPDANFQGKPVYYSYQTCGGVDSFTADVKDACVNQKSSGECSKLKKCAWNGDECLGKELVSVCEADAPKTENKGPLAHEEKKYNRPVGEGAHQDPKAVKQRTTDKNLDCEQGKWNDCYDSKGEYVNDAHDPPKAKAKKSGAAPLCLSIGSLVALIWAIVQ